MSGDGSGSAQHAIPVVQPLHPVGIRLGRLRHAIQSRTLLGRERDLGRAQVVIELLLVAGAYDHSARRLAAEQPGQRHLRGRGLQGLRDGAQLVDNGIDPGAIDGREVQLGSPPRRVVCSPSSPTIDCQMPVPAPKVMAPRFKRETRRPERPKVQ